MRPVFQRSPFDLRPASGDPRIRVSGDSVGEAFMVRRGSRWMPLQDPDRVDEDDESTALRWRDGARVEMQPAQGRPRLVVDVPGAEAVRIRFAVQPDELLCGLGERFDAIDQRGRVVDLWVSNASVGQGAYKPVPWLLSSAGWGIDVAESTRQQWSVAPPLDPDALEITVGGSRATLRFHLGDDIAAALTSYTAAIGRPPRFPKWALMPWLSGDWRVEDQESNESTVELALAHGLPFGVKLIDAQWESSEHTFEFDDAKYPNPAEMISGFLHRGIRTVLWLSPSMTAGNPAFDEASQRGSLVRDDTGQTLVHSLGNQPGWQGSAIDFTDESTVAWWQANLRQLLDLGVAGFKTDFGEQVPAEAMFASGNSGLLEHNRYPTLYNEASWEVVRERGGLLLARSAWTGSQAFSAVWAGDQSSDTNPWAGLGSVIVAAQSSGLSGFPIWGSDIGGYYGVPTEELYIRWTQFAALTPIMQVHGLGARQPWEIGSFALAQFRDWANLHVRLIPYFVELLDEQRETGIPPIRALALTNPRDPTARESWTRFQFCLGDALLVAPLYFHGTKRTVRIPDGEWVNWFDGARYTGPITVEVEADLSQMPLFQRSDRIVPILADAHSLDGEVVFRSADGSESGRNSSEPANDD